MPNNSPNLYSLGALPGFDPQARRTMQDLVDQLNFLTGEVGRLKERDLVVIPTGAARRESPIEGTITIPYRDAGGQDGLLRVSKDGVIVSYVNPAESLFPYTDLSIVGNIGAGIDTLHTFTLPAGTLANDGDWIRFLYAGTFATNDNDKRIQILFDSQVFEDFGAFDFDSGLWVVAGDYSRVSPTSIRATSMGMYGTPLVMNDGVVQNPAGTDIIFLGRNTLLTVSNLSTTSVALTVTGTATADNDIVQNKSLLEYYRPRMVKLV